MCHVSLPACNRYRSCAEKRVRCPPYKQCECVQGTHLQPPLSRTLCLLLSNQSAATAQNEADA